MTLNISIKEDEWDEVGDWMWLNRNTYNGLSVLPYADISYPQLPFEGCSKYMYDKMMSLLGEIDLTEVYENGDNTKQREAVACGGGACEI